MSMTLSRCSSPSIVSQGAGRLPRAVQPHRGGLEQGLDGQRRLAAAGDAGDAGEGAERERGGDVRAGCCRWRRAPPPSCRCPCAARAGSRSRRAPVRYWPVIESGRGGDVRGRALGDDLAAVHAGARADVDDVVGLADRLLVVLDDDHGVADVAQVLQRGRAAGRCRAGAGRSTARRARRARRSGPLPIWLASRMRWLSPPRERAGVARQRQVVEADVDQEAEPLADLLQDRPGDLVLLRGQRSPAPPRPRPAPRGSTAAPPRRRGGRRSSPPAPRASAGSRGRCRRAGCSGSAPSPRATRRCRSRGSAAPGSGSRPRTAALIS